MRSSHLFLRLLSVLAILTLGLSGCGKSISGSFALSVAPATLSLAAGASSQISVTATPSNGFNKPLSVALTGLPSGVTASPATLSLTPGNPGMITLSAASTVTSVTSNVTLTATSESLSQAATLTLTTAAAPQPDFSLSTSIASQSLTIGSSGTPISLLVTPVNGFNSPVSVVLSGLPAGVTASPAALDLTPGTPSSLTLTAGTTSAAGTANLILTGTAGSLSHAAPLTLTLTAPPPPPVAVIPDVTTYHYDNTRQGLNASETILTPTNVTAVTFGLLGDYRVDGKVDAQPLIINNLATATATANVLFVATEHASVYALNAATGAQLWKTSVLGANETTSDDHNCFQISPEIGITSTPVIDRTFGSHGAIFVVAMSKDSSGAYHQRLHALDLTTGAELSGSPTEITASFPGTGANSSNGRVIFDPAQYAERVGLTLVDGVIYTGWTSHCDFGAYTGWLIGYNESTFQQTTVLNLTPNGNDGSIWMSGYGIAADPAGNLFLLDANGTLDGSFTASGFPSQGDFGNAILKISTTSGLAVADFWEPFNTVGESNADQDLGSGGAMLLPDLTDSSGNVRHLVVGAGKDTNIYLADRDNMGKFHAGDNSNLYQELPGALPHGAWSGPAFFNNTLFYGGQGDTLKAFSVTNARLSTSPTSHSAAVFAYPGTTPAVSSNGTSNGIVWAVESGVNSRAVLHAYDATDLSRELYNSNQASGNRDGFGTGNKFITPVINNGRVYVGTPESVAVFGLLSASASATQ